MFLLDSNVLSALRRPERAPLVMQWLSTKSAASLYLSVATVGEIESGIFRQQRINPAFAADLRTWLNRTEDGFGDRILTFGKAEARIWGQLSARLGNDRTDLLIAATAIRFDFTLVTGDTGLSATGVRIENPFAA